MTISGSFSGGMSPIPPQVEDNKSTAANENMKLAVGVKPPDTVVPFTQTGQEHNLWKYQTPSNRPVLAPLINVRVDKGSNQVAEEPTQEQYEELTEMLDPEIRDNLARQNLLPARSRDFPYVVLDALLSAVAKVVAWVDAKAATNLKVNAAEAMRAQLNLAIPNIVWQETSSNVQALLSTSGNYLNRDGANVLHFDNQVNLLKQTSRALSSMKSTYDLQESHEGTDAATRAVNIADKMAKMSVDFNKIDFGPDLRINLNTWNALTTVAAAQTLPASSAALMLGLTIATSGIYSSTSPAGVIGPALESLINQLTSGVLSAFIPEATLGGKNLFQLAMTAMLLATIGTAAAVADTGLGLTTAIDESDQLAAKMFAYDLVLHLTDSSQAMNPFYELISNLSGAREDTLALVGTLSKLVTLLLMILYGGMTQGSADTLLSSLSGALITDLTYLGSVIEEAMAEGKIKGELASAVDVALQQAKLALEDGDSKAFMDAAKTLLAQMGVSYTQLNQDLSDVNKFTSTIRQAFNKGNEGQINLTGIVQAA